MIVLITVMTAAVHRVSCNACQAAGSVTCLHSSASPSRVPSCTMTSSGITSTTVRYTKATERTPQRPHGRGALLFFSDEEIVVDRFIYVPGDRHLLYYSGT